MQKKVTSLFFVIFVLNLKAGICFFFFEGEAAKDHQKSEVKFLSIVKLSHNFSKNKIKFTFQPTKIQIFLCFYKQNKTRFFSSFYKKNEEKILAPQKR